jgi:hypothetical protein
MLTRIAAAAIALAILSTPGPAEAQSAEIGWDITGGQSWEGRTGLGLMIGVGGNDCTDDYCTELWDTRFFGSIGGFVGVFYRLIPNLSVFADFHLGYINTDTSWGEDDGGMLIQLIAGGEFHAPITGWLDAHLGLGLGFAHLRTQTERADGGAAGSRLNGFDIELRFGTDVYLFSAVPTLGLGPYFKLGFPIWLGQCVEGLGPSGEVDECGDPGSFDDLGQPGLKQDDLPFLVHFGLGAKYGF